MTMITNEALARLPWPWPDFTPERATRITPAWLVALAILSDHEWHQRSEVADAMTRIGDEPITRDTAISKLGDAARNRVIERRNGEIRLVVTW